MILPTLLCAYESWTFYRQDIKRLKRFQQKKPRRILGINGWTASPTMWSSPGHQGYHSSPMGESPVQNAFHLIPPYHPNIPTTGDYEEVSNGVSRISWKHPWHRQTESWEIELPGAGPSEGYRHFRVQPSRWRWCQESLTRQDASTIYTPPSLLYTTLQE